MRPRFLLLLYFWVPAVAFSTDEDGPGNSRIISVEETKKLKAIRDAIGEITGLDKLYEDRTHENGLPYHVYVPKELKPGVKYPMVTFLHGYTDLTIDTHKGFPKGVWSLPRIQKAHPHILFIPRNRKRQDNWSSEEYRTMTIKALDDFVAEMNGDPKTPNVDGDRLYLTGFSRGGQGTWNFIRMFPNKFAAAAPLSGFSHGPQNAEEAEAIKHIPIWIFNGDGDRGVKGSRISFKALKDAGARDVRYHEYLKQGHVIDDFAYFTDGFMDWLFAQKRKEGTGAAPPQSGNSEPTVFRVSKQIEEQTAFLNPEFLVFSPELKDSKTRVPLLIYLHGAGGVGDEIRKITGQARGVHRSVQKHAPGSCLMVAPQCSRGKGEKRGGWIPEDLNRFLQHLKATFPVDENRVYLTGSSMGGYGTWVWAGTHPEHFAAVAPMVGGIGPGGPKDVTPDLDKWVENLLKVPVWAFAGGKDRVVPAERSERVINAVKKKGHKNAHLTVYPDEGHGAGRIAYADPEFYKWLFSQVRKSEK